MSWATMSAELQGMVPIPPAFAPTLVNRAWKSVQREWLWSFLYKDFSIPTPAITSAGSVALVPGLSTIVGNAAAVAAWNLIPSYTPLIGQQFRIGTGTIYNIIGFAGSSLTLDRPYVDTGTGVSAYQIYQVYFNAPVKNFLWFESIKDPVTGYSIRTTMTRTEADDVDPQRLQTNFPNAVIPYQINLNAGPFLGFPMYEMWPAPTSGLTYAATAYLRPGDFDNTIPGVTDTVPPQLGEDVVMEMAKMKAYEWAIANPNAVPKGADWKYLNGLALQEYGRMLNPYITQDETFSKRNTIPYAERQNTFPELPWVSQSQNIAVWPA